MTVTWTLPLIKMFESYIILPFLCSSIDTINKITFLIPGYKMYFTPLFQSHALKIKNKFSIELQLISTLKHQTRI